MTDSLVELIGRAIADGSYGPGSVIDFDAIMKQQEVSRGSLREAVRTLMEKNLLAARQGVGTRIRSSEQWNLLDPQLLGWLQGTAVGQELSSHADIFAELLRSRPELADNPFVAQALAAVAGFTI